MIEKENLKRQIKNIAGHIIYNRGVNYYNQGFVQSIEVKGFFEGKIVIEGTVDGTRLYKGDLIFDVNTNKFRSFDCNCPYSFDCKHSVALALYFTDLYTEFYKSIKDYILEPNVFAESLTNFIKSKSKNTPKQQEEVEKHTKQKFNPKDYYLEIKENIRNISLNLYPYNSPYYYAYPEDPEKLKNEFLNSLSQQENEFLTLLSNHDSFSNQQNLEKIFKLAHKLKIKIHHENYQGKEIKIKQKPEKIKVKLDIVESYDYSQDDYCDTLVLKLHKKYRGTHFIKSGNCLIEIKNNQISLHTLSKDISPIIERLSMRSDYGPKNIYYPEKVDKEYPVQEKLDENEIIKINRILEVSKKQLDLKTKIQGNFKVTKFKNAEPCILINYDYQEKKLKIYTTVDYGFTFVRTSKTIYYSNSKYNNGFKRRYKNDTDKYVIEVDLENKKINYAPLNKNQEIEVFKTIYEANNYYGVGKKGEKTVSGVKGINKFIEKYYPRMKQLGWKIAFERDKFEFEKTNFKANLNIDMNANNDWLYFDVDCYCNKDKVSLKDLKKFIKSKDKLIRMEDGRLLKITNRDELERFIFMLENFHQKENDKYEGKIYNAPELENIFTNSKYYQAKVADSFEKFMNEAKDGRPIENIQLPSKIKKTLRNYQKDGIDWFYFLKKYRFAGILADDMGLGKTLQALVLIQREKTKEKPSMVVCPKTLLYNWQDEAKKFTPNLKVKIIEGNLDQRQKIIQKAKRYDLLVTSYSALRNDLGDYKKSGLKLNYLILDEAQFIKNHKTKTTKAVKEVDAGYRLALTGTPLENNVSEIWSIFDFLMPGFLGSQRNFVKQFQAPIMKNNDAKALKLLHKKTECFMLRRIKGDVLKELPPKIEQVSHCQLGKDQNILYQEILSSVKKEIFETIKEKGFAKSQIHILAALTKLRQLCNHPVLLLKDKNYKKYESAKLDLFLELVEEITSSDRKVLVFSQFTKMLDILALELKDNDIEYLYLSGKTKNRQELVRKFNKDKKHKVFLISLKAGGTGLNLTSADNVIIFDPWWNPSVENQAIDRTHRIGQKNSVNVYRLITKGTIEEKIVELQHKKKALFDNVVGESKDLFQKLTWNDIKNIFD